MASRARRTRSISPLRKQLCVREVTVAKCETYVIEHPARRGVHDGDIPCSDASSRFLKTVSGGTPLSTAARAFLSDTVKTETIAEREEEKHAEGSLGTNKSLPEKHGRAGKNKHVEDIVRQALGITGGPASYALPPGDRTTAHLETIARSISPLREKMRNRILFAGKAARILARKAHGIKDSHTFFITGDAPLHYGATVALEGMHGHFLVVDPRTGTLRLHEPEMRWEERGVPPFRSISGQYASFVHSVVDAPIFTFRVTDLNRPDHEGPVHRGDPVWLVVREGRGFRDWYSGSVLGAYLQRGVALNDRVAPPMRKDHLDMMLSQSLGILPMPRSRADVMKSVGARPNNLAESEQEGFGLPEDSQHTSHAGWGRRHTKEETGAAAPVVLPPSLSPSASGSVSRHGSRPASRTSARSVPSRATASSANTDRIEFTRVFPSASNYLGVPCPIVAHVPKRGDEWLEGPVTPGNRTGMYSKMDAGYEVLYGVANARSLVVGRWRFQSAEKPSGRTIQTDGVSDSRTTKWQQGASPPAAASGAASGMNQGRSAKQRQQPAGKELHRAPKHARPDGGAKVIQNGERVYLEQDWFCIAAPGPFERPQTVGASESARRGSVAEYFQEEAHGFATRPSVAASRRASHMSKTSQMSENETTRAPTRTATPLSHRSDVTMPTAKQRAMEAKPLELHPIHVGPHGRVVLEPGSVFRIRLTASSEQRRRGREHAEKLEWRAQTQLSKSSRLRSSQRVNSQYYRQEIAARRDAVPPELGGDGTAQKMLHRKLLPAMRPTVNDRDVGPLGYQGSLRSVLGGPESDDTSLCLSDTSSCDSADQSDEQWMLPHEALLRKMRRLDVKVTSDRKAGKGNEPLPHEASEERATDLIASARAILEDDAVSAIGTKGTGRRGGNFNQSIEQGLRLPRPSRSTAGEPPLAPSRSQPSESGTGASDDGNENCSVPSTEDEELEMGNQVASGGGHGVHGLNLRTLHRYGSSSRDAPSLSLLLSDRAPSVHQSSRKDKSDPWVFKSSSEFKYQFCQEDRQALHFLEEESRTREAKVRQETPETASLGERGRNGRSLPSR